MIFIWLNEALALIEPKKTGHLQPSILTVCEVASIPAHVSDFKIPAADRGTTSSSCDVR